MSSLIFLFLCLVPLALSATKPPEETPIKSLLFFDNDYDASPILFRTKQGSISYTARSRDYGKEPEYLLISFNPANMTPILKDISQACDPGMYTFSKLHYHEETSSLVYYCANNNTLLILDENTFLTQETIPVPLNTTYEETRISDDGDSLAIIGLNQFYDSNHPPSHLIIINLKTKTVTTNMVFDKHLNSSQVLVAFASSGSKKYILTSTLGHDVLMNISEIVLSEDTYELTSLATTTYHIADQYRYIYVPEFYCIEDLIITNTNGQLLIFDTQGKVVFSTDFLQFRSISFNSAFADLPVLTRGQAKNIFYANVPYEKRGQAIVRFTVNGSSITSENIVNSTFAQIARGTNLQPGDLIFTFTQTFPSLFSVIDVESRTDLYSMSAAYDKLMSTDSTYAVLDYHTLYIFNLSNDALIENFTITLSPYLSQAPKYYHDVNSGILYVLNETDVALRTCNLLSIDLEKAESSSISAFNDANICKGRITQAQSSTEFAIQADDGSFLIQSNHFENVRFTAPQDFNSTFVIANFTDLSVHLVGNWLKIYGGWTLARFEFNNNTQQFTMTNSSKLPNMNLIDGKTFYSLQENIIYATTGAILSIINITNSSAQTYSFLFTRTTPSVIQDQQNQAHLIISEDPFKGSSGNSPFFLTSNNQEALPGLSENTFGAQAAGPSTYCTTDGYGSSVKLIRFYRLNQPMESIYF